MEALDGWLRDRAAANYSYSDLVRLACDEFRCGLRTVKQGIARVRLDYPSLGTVKKPPLRSSVYERRLPVSDHLYAIMNASTRSVKVGRGHDADKRRALLQVGNEHELFVLAVAPQLGVLERRVQVGISRHWVRGEWYSRDATESISEFVGDVAELRDTYDGFSAWAERVAEEGCFCAACMRDLLREANGR